MNQEWNLKKNLSKKKQDSWRQFEQTQKNQLVELQDRLEMNCNVFPAFSFNSAKKYNNLIKSYLFPSLS